MRVTHHGELVAEIPNKALTDEAPVYQRPVGEWKAPVAMDPPAWVMEELKKPRDYTADLKKLLASREYLRQALGVRAVRLDGAEQYGAGAGRRSRGDADQGDRRRQAGTRAGDGAGGEWAVVLARSEAGRDACSSGGGAQGGLHGRDSGGSDELFELRQP